MDKSKCCGAPVIVAGNDAEGTRYYVCTKCNQACDLAEVTLPRLKRTQTFLDECAG